MSFKEKIKEIFGLDLRSLVIFRIYLGLILIYDSILRLSDFKAHYTDYGVLSRSNAYLLGNKWHLCLHFFNGGEIGQLILFFISIVSAVFIIFGFKTRLCTFISWFLLISIHARNPFVINIGDYILKLILFWSFFLPSETLHSIDSKTHSTKPTSNQFLSMGTFGFIIQIAILFIFSAILKSRSEYWISGKAVYNALHLIHFVSPIGIMLRELPFKYLEHLNFSVMYFEFFGPFLFFIPFYTNIFRLIAVVGFSIMILSFGMFIDLENVHWYTIAGLLPLIPSIVWNRYLSIEKVLSLISYQGLEESLYKFLFKNNLIKKEIVNNSLVGKNTLLVNLLAMFFFIYTLQWNLQTLDKKYKFPENFTWIGKLLRLDQRWGMFIPGRKDGRWTSGWHVIVGYKEDGTLVNLLNKDKENIFLTPKSASSMYKNFRWRKFHINLNSKKNARVRNNYAWYLCNTWNGEKGKSKIDHLKIYYLQVEPNLKGGFTEPKPYLIVEKTCERNINE